MTTLAHITTAEQLLKAGDIGRCELVRGELHMMSPAGFRHSRIAVRIANLLSDHVDPRKLGFVVGADSGFLLERDPDTVRAPDAAFVRASRVTGKLPSGYFPGAPDLAVEVFSPGDTSSEVLAKTKEYLDAGVAEVWLVDPDRETVTIHRRNAPLKTLSKSDVISCEDLLPGMRVSVQSIFE